MEALRTINVSKEFEAPVDVLYKAWIEETVLKAWWHPMQNNLVEVQNDIREGGTIKYVFQNGEGEHAFTINGMYREAEPHKRLVYTWNWDVASDSIGSSNYLLHIHFKDVDNGRSRIDVVQKGLKEDEAVQPHQQGWEEALDALSE